MLGCSDWSPGIYKVSGKTGGSKSSRGNIQKEQIKEIYTTEYQEAVKKRLETAKESGTYTTEKMLVEQNLFGTNTLSLYVYFATEEPVSVSYVVSVPIAKLQILEEKSIRKRLIPQNMNFRS